MSNSKTAMTATKTLLVPGLLLLFCACSSTVRFSSRGYGGGESKPIPRPAPERAADTTGTKPVPREPVSESPEETAAPDTAVAVPEAGGAEMAYQEGEASYYAHDFHGRKTANGEKFDMHALTAAHRKLPFNTRVRVVNTQNDKTVIVRINDRGPYARDRIIDLSLSAAKAIGLTKSGFAHVKLYILEPAE